MILKLGLMKVLGVTTLLTLTLGQASPLAAETLTLYTSMPERYIKQTLDAFAEYRPDISVNLFRSGSSKLVGKVLAETAADEVLVDALMVADDISMQQLKDQGLLEPYFEAPVAKLPAGSYDKDMTYFGTKRMSVVLAYNPGKVETPPRSWTAVMDAPESQVILANPLTSGSALAHLWWMVSRFDWPLFETLAINNAQVERSNGAVFKAVASGEYTYGMVLDYVAAQGVRNGSDARFVYPEEGAVVMHQPIALIKGGRNHSAAQAFIDFLLSDAGQALVVEQGYRSLLDDKSVVDGYPEIDESSLTSVDAQAAVTEAPQLRDVFDALFGQ